MASWDKYYTSLIGEHSVASWIQTNASELPEVGPADKPI